MTIQCRTKNPANSRENSRHASRAAALLAACCAMAAAVNGCGKQPGRAQPQDIFTVQRGNLDITVVESGNLQASESQNIASQVSKTLKILEIVDEGTSVTEEDVKNGKILVKLDPASLEEQLFQRESDLEGANASLTEAKESLAIQISDNESSIRAAQLNVTYALNDLRKLVGETIADRVMKQEPEDISAILDDPDLAGQALEDLNKCMNNIRLAKIKRQRAAQKLEYTRKLYARQFVSQNELESDQLEALTQEIAESSAETKLELFRKYDFVKNFQKAWATLVEAGDKLERAKAVARSRLAQAEAKLNSREAGYERAKQRLEGLKKDIESCTIRATQPGFVIYHKQPRWQNTGPLQPGSDIRPKQTIIELPDLSRMAVMVKVHEAQIDTVRKGQHAVIKVDALPDSTFEGTVEKKALIPSAQSAWLNPDLKVYETKVIVTEGSRLLRPGLTATVEILAERLENVLYIPIQAVLTDDDGKHFCYLEDGSRVPVRIGERNRIYVVVEEGLEEGTRIRMSPPELGKETD